MIKGDLVLRPLSLGITFPMDNGPTYMLHVLDSTCQVNRDRYVERDREVGGGEGRGKEREREEKRWREGCTK